jgi:hypothetical protein
MQTTFLVPFLIISIILTGCDPCFGTWCGPIAPPEERMEGDTCIDENLCGNGTWYCSIEITSVEDMDKLAGCSAVGGRLTISGEQIISLEKLKNIEDIRGVLAVQGTHLENLNGLTSLSYIGGLYLYNNELLGNLTELDDVEIEGFTNVSETIEENLELKWNIHNQGIVWVEECPSIINLDSLVNIGGIGDLVIVNNTCLADIFTLGQFQSVSSIRIEGNNNLTTLSGLENVQILRHLEVKNSNELNDLSGLEHLGRVTETLTIAGNPALLTLSGLDGINDIGVEMGENQIAILGNISLGNVDALKNINYLEAGSKLIINGNDTLPSCDVKNLVDYLEGNTDWTAEGNVEEENNLSDECSDLL